MQIRIIAVGKVRERYIAQACSDFATRLAPYHTLEIVEVRAGAGTHPELAMREEGERILALLAPSDRLWLLERTGKQFSSEELSEAVESVAREGTRRLCIAVAGTFGASAALAQRANLLWSLSRLTFLHEWARALVLEQLYRAAKIARGEPYHH